MSRSSIFGCVKFLTAEFRKSLDEPPERERFDEAFDFGDAEFLHAYMAASRKLLKSKGMLPEYLFPARAEMGLYHTLHRVRARVHTSRIVSEQLGR